MKHIFAPLDCRPRGSTGDYQVYVCVCVCVCVCVRERERECVCHRGHYEGLSRCRLVGSCVLPGENFSHRPKTAFARLTQSQAISQSFRVFITFRSMRDTHKCHFCSIFRNSFLYKTTVFFTMVFKRSPGGESAGGGQSTSKSTCVVPA